MQEIKKKIELLRSHGMEENENGRLKQFNHSDLKARLKWQIKANKSHSDCVANSTTSAAKTLRWKIEKQQQQKKLTKNYVFKQFQSAISNGSNK